MTSPSVSVIVVSRGRGDSLALTLTGLSRLNYLTYEIVVVADAEGQEAVRRLGLGDEVKTAAFANPNISEARNRGIALASGEILAFIDDDAVPEPTWLTHLTAPFAEPEVAAVGGFVIGRNGISFQWKAQSVDHTGIATPLAVDETKPTILTPPPGRAIKTEGTNMGFRRSVLAQHGGFDPAYRFYLDETDLNMRLARAGRITAISPMAQVHHAFAPSARRTAARAPKDLFEIGASLAVYLRRHCPAEQHDAVIADMLEERDRSLIAHMIAGRLEPGDVRRLRRRLRDGIVAGQTRDLSELTPLAAPTAMFKPFATRLTGKPEVVAGRSHNRRALRRNAAEKATAGASVSLFVFSPTTLFHRVRMTKAGVWEQQGGLWGKSDRSGPILQLTTFRSRLNRELRRISVPRGLPSP